MNRQAFIFFPPADCALAAVEVGSDRFPGFQPVSGLGGFQVDAPAQCLPEDYSPGKVVVALLSLAVTLQMATDFRCLFRSLTA